MFNVTAKSTERWRRQSARQDPKRHTPDSELVTHSPQEVLPVYLIRRGLDAGRREAVDDPNDAPAELGLRNENLNRVGGRTKDRAHLRDCLDAIQDVHRKPLPEKDDERVTRADSLGVSGGQVDELVLVARAADEAGPDASQNAIPKRNCGLASAKASAQQAKW
jgi:hypothetical protein